MGGELGGELNSRVVREVLLRARFPAPQVVMLPLYLMITLDNPFYTNLDRGMWFMWVNHGMFLPVIAVLAVAAVNNSLITKDMVRRQKES